MYHESQRLCCDHRQSRLVIIINVCFYICCSVEVKRIMMVMVLVLLEVSSEGVVNGDVEEASRVAVETAECGGCVEDR